MEIRLINLDRSTDRLALFKQQNPNLDGFRRISAIDGRAAVRSRLIENDVLAPDLEYSDGALGCALSHLTQWRDAIQHNVPLTIVEDDAILAANFKAESSRLVSLLPDDWEFIMWGYNFDALMTFDLLPGHSPTTAAFNQQALRTSSHLFASDDIESRLFKLISAFGTVCYSISPKGASRLLNFCMPLRNVLAHSPGYARPVANTGIDNMLQLAWPAMQAYVAVPPLAVTNNDHETSTVQLPRNAPALATEGNAASKDAPPYDGAASTPSSRNVLGPVLWSKAKNLLVVRCGQKSLHWEWLEGGDRNWDIVLVPFELIDAKGLPCFLAPGQKWAGLYEYFINNNEWKAYDYICMPDDDIRADTETWNRFFDYCYKLDINIAAPALTPDSYFTHLITMQNKSFLARATTFVEIMNPCLSQAVLQAAIPTMNYSKSGTGFGLDSLWPAMVGYKKVWIIDDTPVVHTRPAGVLRDRHIWALALYDQRRIEGFGVNLVRNTMAGYSTDAVLVTNEDSSFGYLYEAGYQYLRVRHPERAFELASLSTKNPLQVTSETFSLVSDALSLLTQQPFPLSRNKPSLVSSVCRWSWSTDPAIEASGGNDGRLNGRYGFHTAEELDPWWQVDLLAVHNVSSVVLHNRLDQITRCRDLDILSSVDGVNWQLDYRKRDKQLFGGLDGSALFVTFTEMVPARFIRVQAIGITCLHLDQVEVFGPPSLDDDDERASDVHYVSASSRLEHV